MVDGHTCHAVVYIVCKVLDIIVIVVLLNHREGIDWADIEWVDNAECLDLVEKVCACIL